MKIHLSKNTYNKDGFLAESTIKRLIGPVPKSAPGYDMILECLRSSVQNWVDRLLRKIARLWCEAHAIERQYRRARSE
jgi:hypothetical protein